ncbi:MAG: stage V sporulation protein B [Paenibacillaceae bacterium]|nr:stage V sporulation protein B [Paenibacillaceae bacterium]
MPGRKEGRYVNQLKQSFIKGTMILLVAGIVNRILGFLPRIALPRLIGAEGVGLYQLGYPFLILILTIITGGVPLAVAKLVAEADATGDEARIRRILRLSMALTTSLGALFTSLCLLFAPLIMRYLLTDSRVYLTFVCMTPIIVLVGISSVMRGYFQGRQNMIPTAASQIAETIARIVAMLLFAQMLLPFGIEYAAAGAMIGVTVGELIGLLVTLVFYFRSRGRYAAVKPKPKPEPDGGSDGSPGNRQLMRHLLRIALPVTASRLVGSTSYLLESIFIAQSLALAGIPTAIATAQYGALQGMIIPILLLPSALTFSLSTSLVPTLSQAAAAGDMRTIHKRLHQSLRLALITGAPFAVIMFVLAEPLCYYLYHNTDIAVMLKMMAPVALFIYFQAPLQAALQALDRPGTALVNSFIGSAIKLTLIVVLASRPSFGILGAVLAININIVAVTLLHWASITRQLKFGMPPGEFVKVGAAMLAMGFAAFAVETSGWPGNGGWRFVAASFAGTAVYLACVAWMKLIDKYDLRRIPFPWTFKR